MLHHGTKFSCRSCLLGHRSACCPDSHATRHLYEVKKKGRPSTQCDECKAKRERTGGHIRCVCPRPEERPPLELPNGIPGAAIVDLPAPLVRNTSTSSATSSTASSRAASVPAESLDAQTLGRKKSVSKSKRKDSSAATKPHDLAHGAAHLPSHVYSPYHTPIPHCRSAPMSKTPSLTSSDHSHPSFELPPLPLLPTDFGAPAPNPALPAELDGGASASVGIDEFIASLDPNYWPAVPFEAVEGMALKAEVDWPVGVGAAVGEAWPVATSSIGSAGGSEVNYGNAPGMGFGDWPQADNAFDLSTEIDKWRQVLLDESSNQQQLPPLPTNNEWIAPHFTEEPDYSSLAANSAPFTPELAPFPTSTSTTYELPRSYLYDEGFFSSSSASSKAASSVAGSEYSVPVRQASQLSLSLVDFDLSLEAGAGAFEMQQGAVEGYWDGQVDGASLFIPPGGVDVQSCGAEAGGNEVAC